MTKKEKVLGLFDFLMDLLDDESPTPKKEIKQTLTEDKSKEKVLVNPLLPHHPFSNPYIPNPSVSKPKWVDSSLDLMKKVEEIDREHAEELGKNRAVKKAVSPLIEELEKLKKSGIGNAIKDRDEEILKDVVTDVGDKLGITLENGKVKLVDVPNELRDNIPLNEVSSASTIGVNIKKTDLGQPSSDPSEIRSTNDLPKGVKEEYDKVVTAKTNTLENAIKKAMDNPIPSAPPINNEENR